MNKLFLFLALLISTQGVIAKEVYFNCESSPYGIALDLNKSEVYGIVIDLDKNEVNGNVITNLKSNQINWKQVTSEKAIFNFTFNRVSGHMKVNQEHKNGEPFNVTNYMCTIASLLI